MTDRVVKAAGQSSRRNYAPSLAFNVQTTDVSATTSTNDGQYTDELLVTRAKAGDKRAFGELCRRHERAVRRRVYRVLRNHDDAEDITQEALIKAYTHLDTFRSNCTFKTWLMSIAINSSLMYLRKKRIRSHSSLDSMTAQGEPMSPWDPPDPSPDPEQLYLTNQLRGMLAGAIERLPTCLRQIVLHYHREEGTLIEIADAIGITEPAAKARMFRARRIIRRRLAGL